METARLESLEKLARAAHNEKDAALMAKLVVDFTALSGDDRVATWSFLTRGGVEDLDFVKDMHRNLGALILEVFKK